MMSTDRTNEIQETAGEWLARRHSGKWTEREQYALDRWIDESVHHRVAYLRLEHVWRQAGRLQALGAGVHSDRPPPPGQWNLTPFFGEALAQPGDGAPKKTAPRSRPRSRTYAVAASLLGLALVGAAIFGLRPAGRLYETDVGAIASVPMVDGSKVTLNSGSQLRVAVTGTERHVELEHGEAFFEVAHDPNRPFVVQAGKKRVIAVGTKFSVRREEDDVRVVVTEGKVRLEGDAMVEPLRAAASAANPATTNEARSSETTTTTGALYLAAGAIARVTPTGVLVQNKAPSEADEQLGWRTGVLVFRNESLANAIAEFNRYNTRKIVIEDPSIEALRIEGNFRATNVDAFARILERGYSLHVTAEGERIVVRR